jgi:DEAD/DEAH box helicase domain-containing protein
MDYASERLHVMFFFYRSWCRNVDPIETHAIRKISGSSCNAFYGDICGITQSFLQADEPVTAVVFGYFKIDKKNNIIDAVDVDNPPVVINTKGLWLDVPTKALEILTEKHYNIAGSIHAAEHAILSLLPNVVITSQGDVRTECKAPQKEYAQVCSLTVKPRSFHRERHKENDLHGNMILICN